MKKSTLVKGLILGLSFAAFGAQAEEAAAVNEAQLRKDMGYFFGYSFANMLKQGGNTDVDPDTLLQGLKDSLAGVQPALSEEAQRAIVARIQANQEALQTAMQQRQQQEAAANSQSGAAF
ncbi:MAG: FKBP-type peptidyl-prolyl cis-trans isomerase N-terminal domain-containing protein, partial [Pseudomonadales bacterium]|nr:FKBP-type peptidyl-prolyl cis-trans isomerase N-terminal domain-containing protein [Pseudomonadales bacterium]